MEISPKALSITVVVLFLTIMMAFISCGTKTKRKPSFKNKTAVASSNTVNKTANSVALSDNEAPANENFPRVSKRKLTSEQKQTAQLYKRLDTAYSLYQRGNYESALSEVESVMRNLHKDPYLEAQVWAMSAMIYDKQHKNSRRKRAYRKMVECIENLQKDKRYTRMYEVGKDNADLFGKIHELGGKIGENE